MFGVAPGPAAPTPTVNAAARHVPESAPPRLDDPVDRSIGVAGGPLAPVFGVLGPDVPAFTLPDPGIVTAPTPTHEPAVEPPAARTDPGDIPAAALEAYRTAAATAGCDLDWSLLAAIGRVESHHGRFGGATLQPDGRTTPSILGPRLDGTTTARISDTDGGRLDSDTTYDRAVGPMQFIPSTWATYGRDGNGDGTSDPSNLYDATAAAAAYLCAAGGDLGTVDGSARAVYAYNHSDHYVVTVLALAASYAGRPAPADPPRLAPSTLPPVNPAPPLALPPEAPPAPAVPAPPSTLPSPLQPSSLSETTPAGPPSEEPTTPTEPTPTQPPTPSSTPPSDPGTPAVPGTPTDPGTLSDPRTPTGGDTMAPSTSAPSTSAPPTSAPSTSAPPTPSGPPTPSPTPTPSPPAPTTDLCGSDGQLPAIVDIAGAMDDAQLVERLTGMLSAAGVSFGDSSPSDSTLSTVDYPDGELDAARALAALLGIDDTQVLAADVPRVQLVLGRDDGEQLLTAASWERPCS